MLDQFDLKRPIDATLVRRIAEAVDGKRGAEQWFAFSVVEEPTANGGMRHYVSEPHPSRDAAAADAPTGSERHHIGPFLTRSWGDRRNRELSQMLVETTMNGTSEGQGNMNAHLLDSLFWTESSVDKFVIPYYVRIYGPEYGCKIKEAFNDPEVFALTHLPGSEYVAALKPGIGFLGDFVAVPIIPD